MDTCKLLYPHTNLHIDNREGGTWALLDDTEESQAGLEVEQIERPCPCKFPTAEQMDS